MMYDNGATTILHLLEKYFSNTTGKRTFKLYKVDGSGEAAHEKRTKTSPQLSFVTVVAKNPSVKHPNS
jgi:hypothetical protein